MNLRILYADKGITTPTACGSLDIWHCQFVDCNSALHACQNATVSLITFSLLPAVPRFPARKTSSLCEVSK